MFKPISACIAWRYMRAQRKAHFISFISFASMLGIALGVTVLITVLSVMNGFDDEIHKRFFGLAHHVSISAANKKMTNWQGYSDLLKRQPGVVATAPFISGHGLIIANGQNFPVAIAGISPKREDAVSELSSKMRDGDLSQLTSGHYGIVIGKSLAENLGVGLHDRISVMIPQVTVTPAGIQPRTKRFEIVGVFSAGPGFGFDSRLAYINLYDAQKLFMLGKAVNGIRLKLDDIYKAPSVSRHLLPLLPPTVQVNNWTQQFGAFFSAVKMEKTMMFFILLLIIAVAVFNLVSSLVMLVNDKRSDIAILRTYGALPRTILMIFILQGLFIGMIGTLVGVIGGLLLAYNVTDIVEFLQRAFHIRVLSANVYFVNFLPSKIIYTDVLKICGATFILCFLATLYPSWRASKINPAEALRYD